MSHVPKSAGFQSAVSASTANTPRKPRKATAALPRKALPFPCLPFVTDQRGRVPTRCHFDVPLEPYAQGRATGIRAFAALMKAATQAGHGFIQAPSVLQEVFAVLQAEAINLKDAGRRGAADGFAWQLDEYLRLTARTVDHDHMAARLLAQNAQEQAFLAEADRQARQDFVDRMRAGKTAKPAAAALLAGLRQSTAASLGAAEGGRHE